MFTLEDTIKYNKFEDVNLWSIPEDVFSKVGLDSCYICDDLFETKVKPRMEKYNLNTWLCTDTNVGHVLYVLDGQIVFSTYQSARKNGSYCDIHDMQKFDQFKSILLSCLNVEQEVSTEVELILPQEVYTFEYVGQEDGYNGVVGFLDDDFIIREVVFGAYTPKSTSWNTKPKPFNRLLATGGDGFNSLVVTYLDDNSNEVTQTLDNGGNRLVGFAIHDKEFVVGNYINKCIFDIVGDVVCNQYGHKSVVKEY